MKNVWLSDYLTRTTKRRQTNILKWLFLLQPIPCNQCNLRVTVLLHTKYEYSTRHLIWFIMAKTRNSNRNRPPLTVEDEECAAMIIAVMFSAFILIVATRLKYFLRRKGFRSQLKALRRPNDPSKHLKIILRAKNRRRRSLLPGLSSYRVERSLDGRHACAHNDYEDILNNWESYFRSWIRLCEEMGSIEGTRTLEDIYRGLKQKVRSHENARVEVLMM